MDETFPRFPVRRFPGRTLLALLAGTAQRLPEKVFLRVVEPSGAPREVTFAAFAQAAGRAAEALARDGVGPADRVLLLADNSPEWQEVALGAQLLRAEPAALFASLAAEPAQAIARRVAPRVVFVSSAGQWAKLAPIADELAAAGLRAVIAPDLLPGVACRTFAEVTGADATGARAAALPIEELAARAAAIGPEDPFLLLFTSGTTGRPKGVRLPQRAIVHAIDAGNGVVGTTEDDVGLHFLPFAHVAGHDQFFLALGQGHTLVMTSRREDLERGLALGPSYLFSVPLVYDRVRFAVEERVGVLPRPLRALARAALDGAARVRVDGSRAARDRLLARVADRLVGKGVRQRLGGRIRAVYAGGAPAGASTFRFFEALGIPFIELYGMSETAGMISSSSLEGPRCSGSVGRVSPDHAVRITADGELQVRGPLLFTGYLEREDEADAFTEDGFFRTGDLARVGADGQLRIEGRSKHLLVLSTGKKLSPEPIEQAIAAAPPFQGAVLIGEGRPFVAAAVFVAREELSRLAAAGKDAAAELLPRVRAALAAFSEYEVPKRLIVVAGAPADHPGLLTPTLKLKRDAALALLGTAVGELYARAG